MKETTAPNPTHPTARAPVFQMAVFCRRARPPALVCCSVLLQKPAECFFFVFFFPGPRVVVSLGVSVMQFPGSSEEHRLLLLPAFFISSFTSAGKPLVFVGRLVGDESGWWGSASPRSSPSASLHYLLLAAIPAVVRRGLGVGGGHRGPCVSTQSPGYATVWVADCRPCLRHRASIWLLYIGAGRECGGGGGGGEEEDFANSLRQKKSRVN